MVASCWVLLFCDRFFGSKTIISDSKVHPFTSSEGLSHAPFGGLGIRYKIRKYLMKAD